MRRFLTWLGDSLLGPRCPFCIHRGRGTRSLDRHVNRAHPGAYSAFATLQDRMRPSVRTRSLRHPERSSADHDRADQLERQVRR